MIFIRHQPKLCKQWMEFHETIIEYTDTTMMGYACEVSSGCNSL